jgi:hypothetical protein
MYCAEEDELSLEDALANTFLKGSKTELVNFLLGRGFRRLIVR